MGKDAENKETEDGKDPSSSESKPSNTKKKTYSEEEVQALLSTRHSALDKQIYDLTKENRRLKPFEAAIKTAEDESESLADQLAKVKAEFAKKDPDFSSIYQTEEANIAEAARLKKERRQLDAKRAEVEDEIEEANLSRHEKAVKAAAKDAGVSEELLLTIAPKATEGLDLKAIAERLPKASIKDEEGQEGREGEREDVPESSENMWAGWNPDSGLSTGGEGELTNEKLDKMPMEKYAKARGHEKLVTKE